MFCTNCGRELQDGEVCTCIQENHENDSNNYYAGTYYDPMQAYNVQDDASVNKQLPPRIDYPEGYKIKKKYVAVILALSVGMYGIHNFYLGKKDKALVQVLLSTVGAIFTVGISLIAVTIWAAVEGILLFTENIDRDADGYKIQTFEEAVAAKINKD